MHHSPMPDLLKGFFCFGAGFGAGFGAVFEAVFEAAGVDAE